MILKIGKGTFDVRLSARLLAVRGCCSSARSSSAPTRLSREIAARRIRPLIDPEAAAHFEARWPFDSGKEEKET